MRPETFIARRLYAAQSAEKRSSTPAVRVALAGMIIGVVVMVVTICVVVGFKRTITEKIAGFGAHIQVVNFENNNTYEYQPITYTDSLVDALSSLDHITHVTPFFTKPGILKTDDAFNGIVLKGTDYWDYFAQNLIEGTLPTEPTQVIISEDMSRTLRLSVDDRVLCYFVGDDVRVRRLQVSGIYRTGFGDFDGLFVLGQPDLIRQLNQWSDHQASGLELLVDDFAWLEQAADAVYFTTANRLDEEGNAYYTQTIEQLNPQIFSWLDLLDMNVVIILILMLCVAGFNIISGLIILIIDSITMIGTLKALGADNRFVRRIFLTEATMLILRGVIWGNVIGLALVAVQYFTHVLPLDATTYYVNFVPVAFPWLGWIALNIGTILISLLILLAPSAIVTHISPAKVMHFD